MNHQSVEQSDLYRQVEQLYGAFPGSYMSTEEGELAVARIRLGNVTLLPQSLAGIGDNTFQIAHGTEAAPPYPYIATYLWARYGFQADVLIHFGTHGSLEYTPRKQVALSNNDWSDQLIGDLPHLYVYTIGNVGEALIAKRRTYAGIQSHLTPPVMASNVRGTYQTLSDALNRYNQ
jgi:cobaltochelatase CobN